MATHPKTFLPFYWRTLIRPHWRPMAAIALLMGISSLFDMLTIGMAVPLMDVLTSPAKAQQNPVVAWVAQALARSGIPERNEILLFTLMAMACGLFLLQSIFHILHGYATVAIGLGLRRSLKAALLERFLRAPYETTTQWPRGTIVQRINDPADGVVTALGNLAHYASAIITCALMIGLLVCLSWWVSLLIGLAVLVCVTGWRGFAGPRAEAYGRSLFYLRGEENKLEVDAIDGLKVVKAHGLEETMVKLEKGLLKREIRPSSLLKLLAGFPNFLNEVMASIIVLGLGVLTFFFPDVGIRFSLLVAFLLAIRRIAPSITLIHNSSSGLSSLKATLEVVEEVLYRIPQERRAGERIARVEEIRLEDVTFAYRARPNQVVLERVCARMERGAVTAIVGSTGSGKSTLAHLLMGLLSPEHGKILVNGKELSRLDIEDLRRKIGYVSQDVFLFNATVRENIALWEEVSDEEIEWASTVAQLHDFVASLPQGYETTIGDRGLRLSGGQCQRLAIARAILRRPDVLIFDEATSALDNLTEGAVYDAIQALHRESVVIVIAHRLGTVKGADKLIVLQGGRIVEEGIHEELMGRRGVYAKLYGEDRVLKEAAVP